MDRLLFQLLWSVWIVLGARLEEADLLAELGDAYRAYCRQVPTLIPWPKHWKSSSWAGERGQGYVG